MIIERSILCMASSSSSGGRNSGSSSSSSSTGPALACRANIADTGGGSSSNGGSTGLVSGDSRTSRAGASDTVATVTGAGRLRVHAWNALLRAGSEAESCRIDEQSQDSRSSSESSGREAVGDDLNAASVTTATDPAHSSPPAAGRGNAGSGSSRGNEWRPHDYGFRLQPLPRNSSVTVSGGAGGLEALCTVVPGSRDHERGGPVAGGGWAGGQAGAPSGTACPPTTPHPNLEPSPADHAHTSQGDGRPCWSHAWPTSLGQDPSFVRFCPRQSRHCLVAAGRNSPAVNLLDPRSSARADISVISSPSRTAMQACPEMSTDGHLLYGLLLWDVRKISSSHRSLQQFGTGGPSDHALITTVRLDRHLSASLSKLRGNVHCSPHASPAVQWVGLDPHSQSRLALLLQDGTTALFDAILSSPHNQVHAGNGVSLAPTTVTFLQQSHTGSQAGAHWLQAQRSAAWAPPSLLPPPPPRQAHPGLRRGGARGDIDDGSCGSDGGGSGGCSSSGSSILVTPACVLSPCVYDPAASSRAGFSLHATGQVGAASNVRVRMHPTLSFVDLSPGGGCELRGRSQGVLTGTGAGLGKVAGGGERKAGGTSSVGEIALTEDVASMEVLRPSFMHMDGLVSCVAVHEPSGAVLAGTLDGRLVLVQRSGS
ncbi:MAG: hypothetical protein WDW38_010244 [Sanguina aurantia]